MNGTTFLGPAYDPITTSIITTVTSSLSVLILIILAYIQKRLGVNIKRHHGKLEEVHRCVK
jgi:hypothetical protein